MHLHAGNKPYIFYSLIIHMYMSERYFIAKKSQSDEKHLIHKDNCPFLPVPEKRIYLGKFHSHNEALNNGKRIFTNSNCCIFCAKEANEQREDLFTRTFKMITFDQVEPVWESPMLCGVN